MGTSYYESPNGSPSESVCITCGSVVRDMAKHNFFHQQIDMMLDRLSLPAKNEGVTDGY